MTEALVSLLTALGDDELILGHRHSEWTGHAPHIEEDVAFSSIAQDEIGHAAAYYSLIAEITDDDADRFAFGRDPGEYRHAVVCERPNRDWAYTLVRHWLYDTADDIRLNDLESSTHKELSAMAVKLRREERYHLLHADMWMWRVARGPVEGRARIIDAMTDCFEEATAIFEPVESENETVEHGWMPSDSTELRARFVSRAAERLDALGLGGGLAATADDAAEFVASSSGDLIAHDGEVGPPSDRAGAAVGGRAGRHSSDFDELWTVMTSTYRSDPGATW